MGNGSTRLTPLHDAAWCAPAIAACIAMTAPARGEAVQRVAIGGHVAPRCWTAMPRATVPEPTVSAASLVRCSSPAAAMRVERRETGRSTALPARVTITPRA